MNFAALPLLFNGLFFSISPSAVHNATPGKPLAVLKYNQPACENLVHEPGNVPMGHCTPNSKKVKVQVSFKLNEKKELEVISVIGSSPGVNAAILQNIGNWMPGMKSYLLVNKTYSFTLEICNEHVS